MNRKQISKFLNSIIPGVEFCFRYASNKELAGSPAAVDYGNVIMINRNTFRYLKPIEQKGILLHEVGHILTGINYSQSDTELYAQLAAIQIAKDRKWDSLYKQLKKYISSWVDYTWNQQGGIFRRYIIAGRKYCGKRINDKTSKV